MRLPGLRWLGDPLHGRSCLQFIVRNYEESFQEYKRSSSNLFSSYEEWGVYNWLG